MISPATDTRHILLVEDDTDIAELLCFVLRHANFEVTHAPSAKEAMALLTHLQPQLFILDLWMPEMDGLQLLRWLREEKGLNQPVLVLTGTVEPGLDEKLMAAGANQVAHKPVDIHALTTLIGGILK